MANVFATKTGNWSDTTVWNTGALPTSADDVYANGFTVTINQNINVLSIRTTSNTGINQGGNFTVSTAYNITTNIIAGSTTCLSTSHSSGTLNIVGDITGGYSLNAFGVNANSSTISHTGNVFGGTSQNTFGVNITFGTPYNLTGNVTGGTGTNSYGIQVAANSTVNITGNCTSGGFAGLNNNSYGTVNIIGNCIATSNFGAINASTGILNVNNAVASTGVASPFAGVSGTLITGTTIVKSVTWGSNGQIPVNGYVKFQNSLDITVNVVKQNLTTVVLQDLANTSNIVPANGDVRRGVVYNVGNNTGTLDVPSPSNVRKGVATDNTVGTAELTASDFWGALLSNNNVTGSFGKLIKDNLDATISSRLASSDYSSSSAPTVQQIRTEMDTNSTKLANLDATVSSRLATSGYTAPPTVSQIRTEIDTNSTKLDVTVGSRLAASTYVTPPTAVQVRTEMDTNSTKLANIDATISSRASASNLASIPTNPLLTNDLRLNNIDAAISSRLATSGYTAPPTVSQIRNEIDTNSTKLDATISSRATQASVNSIPINPLLTNDSRLNNLDATISSRLAASGYTTAPTTEQIWEYAERTLTSSPSATKEEIAQQVWEYVTRGLTESPDVPTAQEISNQVWIDTPVRLENVATADIVAEQLLANLP